MQAHPIEAFRLTSRLLPIAAGLHIIRYVSSVDSENPPSVLLQPMPDDAADIALLSNVASGGFSLTAPGDAIVVRAARNVRVVATTVSLGLPGTEAAVFRIERLDEAPADTSAKRRASVELVGTQSGRAAAQNDLVRRGNPVLGKY